MQPEIRVVAPIRVVGLRQQLCLAENKIVAQWQQFMPQVKNIVGRKDEAFYSVEVYPPHFSFAYFDPHVPFEKWAAVAVADDAPVPASMAQLQLPGGLYAVFIHRGTPEDFFKTAQYIFSSWLPQSGYAVDNRPHFEVMGAAYRHNDPASEEEVWLPIKKAPPPL